MLTGDVLIAYAYCPYCGHEVQVEEAEGDTDSIDLGIRPYALMHHASHPTDRAVWVEHVWLADRFEIRQVFAMELS